MGWDGFAGPLSSSLLGRELDFLTNDFRTEGIHAQPKREKFRDRRLQFYIHQ